MSPSEGRRYAVASQVQKGLATPNVMSPDQARLYSQAVRLEWQASGLPTWKAEEAARQLGDAERLIEAAHVLEELNHPEESKLAYRRAGDILEWLSRASREETHPKLRPVPLALLAGAAFQMAGYPAMAKGLLGRKRLSSAEGNMFAAFLRADFARVLDRCVEYWRERPELTVPVGDPDPERADELVSSELVRCLGLISQSLRLHDQPRLGLSLRKLKGMARLAGRTVSDDLWLTIALTADVAELYARASLWSWAGRIGEGMDAAGRESLSGYVRNQFRAGRGLLWPSQQEGLMRMASGASFAMCTPTGSGKTTIAELAIVKTLYRRREMDADGGACGEPGVAPLVLYLVPSRALAAEVEARLAADIGAIDRRVTITGIYGGADWSLADRWLTADGPTVLVCTVEMAEALLRYVGPVLIRRLRLVIVDEAHQVQFDDSFNGYKSLRSSENRAAKLEQFAARLFTNAPDCPAVALSAVAGGAEEAIARWIGRDASASAHGQDYRSTRQLIGTLDCAGSGRTRIRLELVDGKPLHLSGRGVEAYIPTPFVAMPRTSGALRTDLAKFVRCHSLWAAIQLAKSGRTVLISITRDVDRVVSDFCQALDATSWNTEDGRFFTPPERGSDLERVDRRQVYRDCLSACDDYLGPSSYESRLLARGIAVHHGQLPVRVRRLMTDVVRFNVVPITVATSTLTEGVNMPFDVIVVPSLTRKQPWRHDRFEYVTMSVPEFLNLAGRAGRPGAGVEGITLVVLATDPTSKPGTQAHAGQLDRIQAEEGRFRSLIRSIGETSSSTAAKSPLSHLLTLLWEGWMLIYAGGQEDFLRWLEQVDPAGLSTGMTEEDDLAETLDSLDLLLVSAVEEAERLREAPLEGADLESYARSLWARTYARYAAREVEWLERVFVTRAKGAREVVYADPDRRRLIYLLGLPPRRTGEFLTLAESVEAVLREGGHFASWSFQERYEYLVRIGTLLQGDRTYRLRDARKRGKSPGAGWHVVLRWWLRVKGARSPAAGEVRDWLSVATTDFEFRLGGAINSTITNIVNSGKEEDAVPTLDEWKQITRLPWAAFWLRDLLAWGTLEPVVAYLMAVSSSDRTVVTRGEAEGFVANYHEWHAKRHPNSVLDEFFNPIHLSEWHEQTFEDEHDGRRARNEYFKARLRRRYPADSPEFYPVLPCESEGSIAWLDAAGYLMAESDKPETWRESHASRREFLLNVHKCEIEAIRFEGL